MSLLDRILPPKWNTQGEDSFVLEDWRHWFGSVMSLIFLIVLPLVFLVDFPFFLDNEHYVLIAIDTAVWLLLLLRVVLPTSKYVYSRYLWIAVIYIMAISFFVVLGPTYARSAWLVFCVVMTALFFGPKAALIASLFNGFLIMALYGVMDPADPAWAETYRLGFGNWLVFAVSASLLSFGASIPVGFLLVRLDQALKRAKAANEQLAMERAQLDQANSELQSQMQGRALAQMALMESEEKLRLMADNLPGTVIYQVVAMADGSRCFIYMSKSVERLNEVTAEDVMADASLLYSQVAPEYVEELAAKELKALESLTTFRHTVRSVLPSGKVRWFDLAATPRVMPDGSVIWDGVQVDVTEREQAKEALRESEKLYRNLVEHAHGGISMADDAFRYVYVNDGFCKILGYEREELLGMDARELWAEETAHIVESRFQARQRGENPPSRYEVLMVRKDGEKRWLEVSASVLTDAAGNVRTVGQFLDVTERKKSQDALRESEALHRAVVENSHDGIVVADSNYCFTYVNDEFCLLTGYPREELVGRDFRRFLAEETAYIPVKHFEARLRGEEPPPVYEFLIQRKDGQKRLVELKSSEFISAKGGLFIVGQLLDITESKEAEKALLESENLYRALAENSHAGIVLIDSDYKFTYVNDEYCKILGYEHDELMGMDIRETLAEETAQVPINHYLARLRGENPPQRYEFIVVRKDGEKRWLEASSSIVTGAMGRSQTMAQLLDITERKKAEEALRESEERFKAIFNAAFQFTGLLTPEGLVLEANQAALDSVGKTLEEVRGTPLWESSWWQGEPKRRKEVKEAVRRAAAGEFIRYETQNLALGGRKLHVDFSLKPIFDADGKVAMLLPEGRDITNLILAEEALRESEEKFRQVIQSSPMGVFMYELVAPDRLVFVGANPAADRMLKVNTDSFMGKTVEEVFPLIAETDLPQRMRDVAAGGADPIKNETVKYGDDRIKGNFELHIFQTAPGKLTVMFQDIAERKKAEQEKARLESQLRQAQKMEAVGTLTSGIAHDFNNILGAILGTTETSLLKGNDKESLISNLGNIRDMSIRGRDLVRRLLSFSRQDEQAVRSLDIAELVNESLELIKATLPANVTVKKQLKEGLRVTADPVQMQQVLLNLCTNAAHAMEKDGGVLSIRLGAKEMSPEEARMYPDMKPGPHVLIEVKDTGCGIPRHVADRIFDPFFTTKPMGRGTGLGLSLAHGIVMSHHGAITASSKEGRGTTMSLLLPREAPGGAAAEKPQRPALLEGNGEHILVVDDEEIIARSTAQILEAFGYRVSAYTSSLEAAAALEDNPQRYDAILTDHMMPGLTGRQLAEIAGELNPGLPVVLMTGMYGDGADSGHAGEVAHILTKPVTINEIGQAVRQALDAHGGHKSKAMA